MFNNFAGRTNKVDRLSSAWYGCCRKKNNVSFTIRLAVGVFAVRRASEQASEVARAMSVARP